MIYIQVPGVYTSVIIEYNNSTGDRFTRFGGHPLMICDCGEYFLKDNVIDWLRENCTGEWGLDIDENWGNHGMWFRQDQDAVLFLLKFS